MSEDKKKEREFIFGFEDDELWEDELLDIENEEEFDDDAEDAEDILEED